ncbi:hypothetical protein JF729_14625 [Mycobacterium intracellulare]|uniref:hypothetical protein n=1 Tax=Mycobacterium intracellulare TaxID=1767 RepID=UPI001CD9A076|nr:hypothetical protein [Mycobacterium intracellulare]MCA2249017.1 hypothetical protein [Mycobacterium intracellulare]
MDSRAPYRPPKIGIEYNEFVGELRPPTDRTFTEVHVRYGKRNGRYLDWSITLRARKGDVEEFRESKDQLERRTLEIVEVSESAIRRHVFDPYSPDQPPQTTVIAPLLAGDGAIVDQQFEIQWNGLCQSWIQKHGSATDELHNQATMWFATTKGRPDFQPGGTFDWVHNTLVCVSTDMADAVIAERAGYYFSSRTSTAGVLMPDGVTKFINIEPGGKVTPDQVANLLGSASEDGPMAAAGDVTMGMLVESIYAVTGDWTDGVDDVLGG